MQSLGSQQSLPESEILQREMVPQEQLVSYCEPHIFSFPLDKDKYFGARRIASNIACSPKPHPIIVLLQHSL